MKSGSRDYLYALRMELSNFIKSLLEEGRISVLAKPAKITVDDINKSRELLHQYYQDDILEMAFTAPDFSEQAALWAAQYFYNAVQLTVVRELDEQMLEEQLTPFPGNITASTIYSADLILRYLPELFSLAKGLAPADILVSELETVASSWPFSSVGITVKRTIGEDIIFTNAALTTGYIDRIIRRNDTDRLKSALVTEHIQQATGDHLKEFWPSAASYLK